jgi:hypothetical protein
MAKGYTDGLKQRSIYPGHKVFQVIADTAELKTNESGEDGAC